jgi:hypothetical protein
MALALLLGLSTTSWADPPQSPPDVPGDNVGAVTSDPPLPPVTADTGDTSTGTTQDSPEPATVTLLGLAGAGALWRLRKRSVKD